VPWARVEGSARWCDGPSRGGFNSQSGVDRGSCRALMLMTCTAMKCGANRALKEWVRQVQFEFVHNVRIRGKGSEINHGIHRNTRKRESGRSYAVVQCRASAILPIFRGNRPTFCTLVD